MGKYHTPFRFQPSILTVFCFFAGIFAGTMWVNRMGAGLKEQLGVFGQAFLTGSTQPPSLELLAELLLKRSLGIGILWLLGMSLFAVPGFCLAGRLRRFFDGISYILNDGAGGADGSISLPAFRIPADDILSSGYWRFFYIWAGCSGK